MLVAGIKATAPQGDRGAACGPQGAPPGAVWLQRLPSRAFPLRRPARSPRSSWLGAGETLSGLGLGAWGGLDSVTSQRSMGH